MSASLHCLIYVCFHCLFCLPHLIVSFLSNHTTLSLFCLPYFIVSFLSTSLHCDLSVCLTYLTLFCMPLFVVSFLSASFIICFLSASFIVYFLSASLVSFLSVSLHCLFSVCLSCLFYVCLTFLSQLCLPYFIVSFLCASIHCVFLSTSYHCLFCIPQIIVFPVVSNDCLFSACFRLSLSCCLTSSLYCLPQIIVSFLSAQIISSFLYTSNHCLFPVCLKSLSLFLFGALKPLYNFKMKSY